ncbi:MAG: glycosyltransferase family 1 protein [Pseudolabrys sp.]|nr:glycosyltransferase family 1 protein [Pseudolabrys sp.]
MRILVATDAWHPQVNGVVRTLSQMAKEAPALGAQIEFLAPDGYFTLPMPSYPEIRLALPLPGAVEKRFNAIKPDAVHVATEGPLGHAVRALCMRRGLPFTTSLHTRFPEYLAERLPLPEQWVSDVAWRWLRRFHAPGVAVMAATPTLVTELQSRGFHDVKLWARGVDAQRYRPRAAADRGWKRPVFLTVGRVAVEKNIEAFLALDLPGTKLVVGDGPARASLERKFPNAVFLGARHGEGLAQIYAAADVFVFPSLTDTFGLVMLEALASGVPVAALPADAPRDVLAMAGDMPVGAINSDLRLACLEGLECSREACRDFALTMTWKASAETFLKTIAEANGVVVEPRGGRFRFRRLRRLGRAA